MEKLDLESLLKKNPHLDKEEFLRLQKKVKKARANRANTKTAPRVPFGRREQGSGNKWEQTTDPAFRSYYKSAG